LTKVTAKSSQRLLRGPRGTAQAAIWKTASHRQSAFNGAMPKTNKRFAAHGIQE
jgi:hypothetical protein